MGIDVAPNDTIAEAVAAWGRIKSRATFDDWVAVARALVIGRSSAMMAATSNKPMGGRYNKAFGAWLRGNGLDGISNQERYRAILVLENLPAIEQWRATLHETKLRKFNHPNAIWAHWQRSIKEPAEVKSPRRPPVTASLRRGGPTRAVCFPQDFLRRAHRAMLESRSSDFLTLARRALEAAIRNDTDLLELLPVTRRSPNAPAIQPAENEILVGA